MLWNTLGNVSSLATEQAEVLLEMALSLCLHELAVVRATSASCSTLKQQAR